MQIEILPLSDSGTVDPKPQISQKKDPVSESLFFYFAGAGAGLYGGLTILLEMDRVSAAAIAVISVVSSFSVYSRCKKMAEADRKRYVSPEGKASLCFFLTAGISTLFWTRLNIKIPIIPPPTYSFSGVVSSVLDYPAWKMKLNNLAFDFRNSLPTFSRIRNISLITVGGIALSALIYAVYRCLSPFSSFTCLIGFDYIPKDLLVTIRSGESVHHYNLINLLHWFMMSGSANNPVSTLPVPQNVFEQINSWIGLNPEDLTQLLGNRDKYDRYRLLLVLLNPTVSGLTRAHRRNRIRYWEHMKGIYPT